MTVRSKKDLFARLRESGSSLRALGVEQLGVFGSFARDQQNEDSDVDLLVRFHEGQKSFDNFMRLGGYLEDLLGRSVDLVTPEALSPYLGPYILEDVEYAPLSP